MDAFSYLQQLRTCPPHQLLSTSGLCTHEHAQVPLRRRKNQQGGTGLARPCPSSSAASWSYPEGLHHRLADMPDTVLFAVSVHLHESRFVTVAAVVCFSLYSPSHTHTHTHTHAYMYTPGMKGKIAQSLGQSGKIASNYCPLCGVRHMFNVQPCTKRCVDLVPGKGQLASQPVRGVLISTNSAYMRTLRRTEASGKPEHKSDPS